MGKLWGVQPEAAQIEAQWESRYQTNDMPWEKGEASPGLEDFFRAHQQGAAQSALVSGCGTGHDVRVLARSGLQAVGLDLAPSAVRLCQERTLRAGLRAEFRLGNFLTEQPVEKVDWLIEHTLFCAIHPSQREEYVQAVLRWLKPTGQYLAIFYLIPGTDGPPFGTDRGEIMARFGPYLDLIAHWVPRSYPNRRGLEWACWWRRKTP